MASEVYQLGGLNKTVIFVDVDDDGNFVAWDGGSGGAGGDGAINDGVTSSIKATVFDRTNSNPLATQLVDSNGDPVSVGGGTQYAEDTPATAGEQITMAGVVRRDTGSSMVDTDGDRTELQVDASGNLRVNVAAGGTSGTQYTEGDIDASITGTALMMEDGSDTLRAATGNVANGLDVDVTRVQGTVAVTQSGAWDEVGIHDSGNSITVDAPVGTPVFVRLSDGAAPITALPVTDNAGSLTVDNAALSVVGGGAEATALRVTIANDSTGVVSIDDNGGSLTVDGTVAISGTVPVSNTVLSVVGGGTEAAAQRVTIANDSTGVLSVDDNGSSLTVDNTVLSVVGGGTEAAAQRVTIANDSTGVLSVDDNGGSLTVDGTVGISGNVTVVGSVAEDGAVANNPVQIAGRAHDGVPSAMSANNDVVIGWNDRSGARVVIPHVRQTRVAVTPTISTSGYVDNDQVGGEMTFAAALASGRPGMVVGATLTSRTIVANGLELWLFNADPTVGSTDGGAWDITDANLESAQLIGVIDFTATDYRNTASGTVCVGEHSGGPVSLPFVTSGSANIFGYLVMNGAPAGQYAGTTDLVVSLYMQQF